ncbi:MAG: 2-dehydropantoate 2-reductase [Acidobacteria bacterium]|nr:MAG: 2-dehydropantoate 2-reductase [Acidobacteriota bacterium]
MRIAVVGAGGVGGYFGGKLAHAGVDTIFIARGATLDALRTRGLRVESIDGDFTLERVNATEDPSSVGIVDAILVCVKAWQIPKAASRLAPMIGPDTIVVPMENGIDAPDVLAPIVGREHVLGGLCGIVSFVAEAGHIKHIAAEPFVMFGELDNRESDRAIRLRDAFRNAKVKADVPHDILHSMWTKFLFIVPMSAIGALTRVPIGVWRTMPELRAIAEDSLREMIAIAKARGVDPGDDALQRTMERYDNMAPNSTSSLQRDVLDGKPSELDAQIGAVVRLARESGVAAPVASFLYSCLLPQEEKARA